ncbi:helix-turn-helix domain-containing protein [Myxococcus sp. CA039A]|uniref:helix-turn-helix domain-containing protein n=1 Tax=Myxococcus sp. CA039A TaxID=2741737 RepID=UPI00157B10CF|nr:helix-turn-helix domain-containing protein [Myxococcus sp. CA039A]NTX57959.1 helix-turn-helix domain-containing protein [Myxococcus sp. CA039A]
MRKVVREELAALTNGDLLTIAEAAALIRGGERTIQEWFRSGHLKRMKHGRKVLVSRTELMEVLKQEPAALSETELEARANQLLGRAG